jgi:uncharacterized protein involved in high-affinity Fe2+ transport
MPVVWHSETGVVPPDVSPQVEVRQDGSSVASFAPWAMLSQPMGFHFGDNVTLPGDGTYTVSVQVGTPSARRVGALEADTGASFDFEVEYSKSTRDEISYRDIPAEKEGTRGALAPMEMEMLPNTQVPTVETLPGDVRGTAESGDATVAVTVLDDATRFGGGEDEQYLAVSPRTPHNRYGLPLASLSATLTREGESVFDDVLPATLAPDMGPHYGAVVSSVESGDSLTVTVDAPPQMARHEGYETAFLAMDAMTLSL